MRQEFPGADCNEAGTSPDLLSHLSLLHRHRWGRSSCLSNSLLMLVTHLTLTQRCTSLAWKQGVPCLHPEMVRLKSSSCRLGSWTVNNVRGHSWKSPGLWKPGFCLSHFGLGHATYSLCTPVFLSMCHLGQAALWLRDHGSGNLMSGWHPGAAAMLSSLDLGQ